MTSQRGITQLAEFLRSQFSPDDQPYAGNTVRGRIVNAAVGFETALVLAFVSRFVVTRGYTGERVHELISAAEQDLLRVVHAQGLKGSKIDPDAGMEAIVSAIRQSEDPFVAAGQWLTKLTNAITEAAKAEPIVTEPVKEAKEGKAQCSSFKNLNVCTEHYGHTGAHRDVATGVIWGKAERDEPEPKPTAVEICEAPHPERSGVTCQREVGHTPEGAHSSFGTASEPIIRWRDGPVDSPRPARPGEARCGKKSAAERYTCGRIAGHRGGHVAYRGDRWVAGWQEVVPVPVSETKRRPGDRFVAGRQEPKPVPVWADRCGAEPTYSYFCTQPKGHALDHEAWVHGSLAARWPQ